MMGGSYSKENARRELQLFRIESSAVKVAKRRLKYSCGICEKPILRWQKYVKRRKFVGFGYAIQYAHVECLEEG